MREKLMTRKVKTTLGKCIVYLDRHPILDKARKKFENAKKEDLFLLDKQGFYWELTNYFARYFKSDDTYNAIWNEYPCFGEGYCDIRYTWTPKSSCLFPVLGIAEQNIAIYAVFPLTPTPILDKNDKKFDHYSDGIAVLTPDLRLLALSCIFTSDLYDKVCDIANLKLENPQRYKRNLAKSKQRLDDICHKLRITPQIQEAMVGPQLSKAVHERIRYKGSFGVWLP